MSTGKLHYIRREIRPHEYIVVERLGGKRAGVYGVVSRRYDGDSRYGATYRWDAISYATGTSRKFNTLGDAAAWLGKQATVPATIEVSGELPDTDLDTLRGLAAAGSSVWVKAAGDWAVLGPAAVVQPGASVSVMKASGDRQQKVMGDRMHRCVIDGHELAWGRPARTPRTNTVARSGGGNGRTSSPRTRSDGARYRSRWHECECQVCGETEHEPGAVECWECGCKL